MSSRARIAIASMPLALGMLFGPGLATQAAQPAADASAKVVRTGETAQRVVRTGETAQRVVRTGETAQRVVRTGETAQRVVRTGETAQRVVRTDASWTESDLRAWVELGLLG